MHERKIVLISVIVFILLVVVSLLLSENFVISTNLLVVGIVILVVPVYIYKFFQFKKIKSYEKYFPSFLRDLSESQRAGLTILQAIQSSTKSDYGPLSSEIRKMNNQLSWNVPLEKVLRNFGKRMRSSKTMRRAIMIIDQANKSGGNIEDTMDSLANNIDMIKEVQEEKSTLLNQHVILMYAIFFIFLGISFALIKFLVPVLQSQTQTQTAAFGFGDFESNPCAVCIDNPNFACVGCNAFFTVSSMFDFGSREDPAAYYRSLFFTMVLIQGFFSGLIAGQIGSDSVTAGIKHSLIMLAAGFFSFIILVRIGIV